MLDRGARGLDRARAVSLKEAALSPSPSALTDSRLATLCAEAARDAFAEYEAQFDEITRRARHRFLARDWHGSFDDARERLRLYSLIVGSLTNRVRELMGPRLSERSVWSATKAVYSALIGAIAALGDCGKPFQLLNASRLRNRRREPGNRVCRYGVRRACK
ncbi:MAG: isocitrate dehydrogenase kinase/phosphatase AceK regulatory subunit [Chthoniobacterales bacterium]